MRRIRTTMCAYLNSLSFTLCHFIQEVLNRMQMKFCSWSRRYSIYCSLAAEERRKILLLCGPLWHSHIAAWKWQEKQPSGCYFCLCQFLPPVSVFLFPLHWCHVVQKCHLWQGDWHLTVLFAHVVLCHCGFISGNRVTFLRKKEMLRKFQVEILTFETKLFQDLLFGKSSLFDNEHNKSAVIQASLSAKKQ